MISSYMRVHKTLGNTEWPIKNGQFRENGNIGKTK